MTFNLYFCVNVPRMTERLEFECKETVIRPVEGLRFYNLRALKSVYYILIKLSSKLYLIHVLAPTLQIVYNSFAAPFFSQLHSNHVPFPDW